MSTSPLRIVRAEGGGYRTDNRYRDKLFECDSGDEVVSISVEYQAVNDRKMVARIMDYNSRLYTKMDDGGYCRRIVNLVLSFDCSAARPPCELLEMMDRSKSVFDKYFFNYGYVSLNIYDIAEKYDRFPCGELRNVLYLFKSAKEDRERCMEDMATGRLRRFRRMSRDAAFVSAVFLGFELDIDDDMEEIDMCKMFKDFKRKCLK